MVLEQNDEGALQRRYVQLEGYKQTQLRVAFLFLRQQTPSRPSPPARSATMIHMGEIIMSKLSARKISFAGQFQTKRSSSEDLATFRSVVKVLKNDPDKLRSVVIKAGITTPSGNLKKLYKD